MRVYSGALLNVLLFQSSQLYRAIITPLHVLHRSLATLAIATASQTSVLQSPLRLSNDPRWCTDRPRPLAACVDHAAAVPTRPCFPSNGYWATATAMPIFSVGLQRVPLRGQRSAPYLTRRM